MNRKNERIPKSAYAEVAKHYPHGRKCPRCGQVLPIEAFPLRRTPEGVRPNSYCFDCRSVVDKEQHTKRGKPNSPTFGPLPSERVPIPALEVGKAYRITDNGRTWQGVAGGDGNSKPVHYTGPCIARYGVNWAVRTSTGIRCFTPATLVGLQIKEVERIA